MTQPLSQLDKKTALVTQVGTSSGFVATNYFYNWLNQLRMLVGSGDGGGTTGFTGTITTGAITIGGTQGSMTFVNGVLVSQVAAA